VYKTSRAQVQALRKYESTKAVHELEVIPNNVPSPIDLGVISRDPSRHFVVFEGKDMTIPETPPLYPFLSRLLYLSAYRWH
jgi:hypothetical protein